MPISVGDSRTFYRGVMATSMADIMETCQRGLIDYTFLGGAQIDAYGNLNSTHIGGEHFRPKVRLPGSGGANDMASNARRTIIIARHEARKLVERVSHLTSPGFLTGGRARQDAGLRGGGPSRVLTDKAVLGFDESTGRMRLISIHPGVTHDDLRASTGFDLEISRDCAVTVAPTPEEVRLIRELDPHRLYISGE